MRPAEAVAALRRGDRSVYVVSAPWLTLEHPDPTGTTLEVVLDHLRRDADAAACGLFWWACVPQRGVGLWRGGGRRRAVGAGAAERRGAASVQGRRPPQWRRRGAPRRLTRTMLDLSAAERARVLRA